MHVEANLYPKPSSDPWVIESLDPFVSQPKAKLTSNFNLKDFRSPINAGFEVYSLKEQDLIEHIVKKLEQ